MCSNTKIEDNKTKLYLKFFVNGPTIRIGQLELVKLTSRKTDRKDENKTISRLFVNKIS